MKMTMRVLWVFMIIVLVLSACQTQTVTPALPTQPVVVNTPAPVEPTPTTEPCTTGGGTLPQLDVASTPAFVLQG